MTMILPVALLALMSPEGEAGVPGTAFGLVLAGLLLTRHRR